MTGPEIRYLDDTTVESLADPDQDSSPYQCEVCGTSIPPTPTGRKPRHMRCSEHKRGSAGTAGGTQKTSRTSASHAKIADGMAAVHGGLSFGVRALAIPTRDRVWIADADIILEHANSIGEAWANLTDTNPTLRKRIEKFLEMAGTLSLVGAYAPVAIAIGVNHVNAAKAAAPSPSPAPDDTFIPSSPFPHPNNHRTEGVKI